MKSAGLRLVLGVVSRWVCVVRSRGLERRRVGWVIYFRGFFLILMPLVLVGPGFAQTSAGTNVYRSVHLPVKTFFNLRTSVSVPDGGAMSSDGVSRYAESSSSRGIPGLMGPIFQNRAIGCSAQSSRGSLKSTILSTREIDEVLAIEGALRAEIYQRSDPNGSDEVQKKADFISRNIGRVRK